MRPVGVFAVLVSVLIPLGNIHIMLLPRVSADFFLVLFFVAEACVLCRPRRFSALWILHNIYST